MVRRVGRRVGAVVAGLILCQLSMLLCLVLAVLVMMTAGAVPLLALAVVGLLLVVPGLAGGALAGLLTDRSGGLYGALTTLGFGETILLVRVYVAPGLGFRLEPGDWSILLYFALFVLLGLCGTVGGTLAGRYRAARPAAVSIRSR